MSFLDIITLSVALALDAAVVSLALSTKNKIHTTRNVFFVALVFSVFQVMMPLFGYVVAGQVFSLDPVFGRILAAVVFACIGIRFVYESMKRDKKEDILSHASGGYSYQRLVVFLGLITSIDALAAGASFSFLGVGLSMVLPSIGLVTFLLSCLAGVVGRVSARVIGDRVEIFGALLLFVLSIRLLFFT